MFTGPLVAVTGVVVRSVTGEVVGTRVGVSVAERTGEATVAVSVVERTGEATGIVAVLLMGSDGSVGRAVNVCATAVLKSASDVAAESTVGPVPGVGVRPGSWLQAGSEFG